MREGRELSANDFYTPTELDALRMENELLAFEVRFLRTQLAGSERSAAQLETQLTETKRQLADVQQTRVRLQKRVAELRTRVADLQTRKAALRTQVADLQAQSNGVRGSSVFRQLFRRTR
jgi:chromosome segregation ATPase